MSRPLILLANDDGYRARGLNAVRDALLEISDVVVCAPASEQSAASHALTLHRPLRLEQCQRGVFSVDGTPADSVFVALHSPPGKVLPRTPDLVVSGLNHGVNLGDDVFYSGTVAAAREGALKGVNALAVSAAPETDFASAAQIVARLSLGLLAAPRTPVQLLNVNFPAGNDWTMRTTRLGHRRYEDAVEFRADPRGREYLWLGGKGVEHRLVAGSDTEAFDEGVVSVTPLVLDLWDSADQGQAADVIERAGA